MIVLLLPTVFLLVVCKYNFDIFTLFDRYSFQLIGRILGDALHAESRLLKVRYKDFAAIMNRPAVCNRLPRSVYQALTELNPQLIEMELEAILTDYHGFYTSVQYNTISVQLRNWKRDLAAACGTHDLTRFSQFGNWL